MTVRSPQPHRRTAAPSEAARLLACSVQTVKNRIRRGEFGDDAGRDADGRWWIYRDRLAPDLTELQQENAALRRRVDELTQAQAAADARHREDRNDLAAVMAILGATRAAAERYRSASDSALHTMQEYKAAADEWRTVAGLHQDLLAQKNMPNDLGELDDLTN